MELITLTLFIYLAFVNLVHSQLDPLPLAPGLPSSTEDEPPNNAITSPRLVSITNRRRYHSEQPSGLKSRLLESLNRYGAAAKKHSGEVMVGPLQALEPIARADVDGPVEHRQPVRALVPVGHIPIHVPTPVWGHPTPSPVTPAPAPFTFPPPPPPPPSVIDGLMALFSTTPAPTTAAAAAATTTVVSIFSRRRDAHGEATIEVAGGAGAKHGKPTPGSVRQWRQRLYNVFKSVRNHRRHFRGINGTAGSKAMLKDRLGKLTKSKTHIVPPGYVLIKAEDAARISKVLEKSDFLDKANGDRLDSGQDETKDSLDFDGPDQPQQPIAEGVLAHTQTPPPPIHFTIEHTPSVVDDGKNPADLAKSRGKKQSPADSLLLQFPAPLLFPPSPLLPPPLAPPLGAVPTLSPPPGTYPTLVPAFTYMTFTTPTPAPVTPRPEVYVRELEGVERDYDALGSSPPAGHTVEPRPPPSAPTTPCSAVGVNTCVPVRGNLAQIDPLMRFRDEKAQRVGVNLVESTAMCNSPRLQQLIQQASKRLIQQRLEAEWGGTFFNVVCGTGFFSYIAHTDEFCLASLGDLNCYAFSPVCSLKFGPSSGIAKEKRERQTRKRLRHVEFQQRDSVDTPPDYYSARKMRGYVNVN